VTSSSIAPRSATAQDWFRRLVLLLVVVVAAVAVLAAWRALFPVSRLTVSVPGGVLRSGGEVWIEAVTAGRGPVRVRLEAVQADRTEVVAAGRFATRHAHAWDLRPQRHSLRVRVTPATLARLGRGPVTLRATALPAPAWPRQPPPVVTETEAECQP
jgi:hypothetical protein